MGKDWKNKRFNNKNKNQHRRNDPKGYNKSSNQFKKNKPPVWNQQEQRERVSLKEEQVGITEYVCQQNNGFMGIIKSRISDFHVNEIDLNGKVLELNDLTVPQQSKNSLNSEEFEIAYAEISDVITADIWEKIKILSEADVKDSSVQPIEIDVGEIDKDKRTQIHKVIRKLYTGKLVSTTVNEETRKLITIMKPKGNHSENRRPWGFPGEYVHFLAYKENMDTSEVATAMAYKMSLNPSQVNYCGTKDKRGKTTQKFCIKKRYPSQILNSIKFIRGVHIGNFEFSNEVIKLGSLKGNRFRIALRHVTGESEQLGIALKDLQQHGFINYFGLQRFGNSVSVPTYEIGVALLKSDYKTACELILKPRDNDLYYLRATRETWWKNRNSAEAASMISNNNLIEKKLLDGLAAYGENDYATALRKIPRNMLLLYPHAWQSLIFNRIASRRIKEFGLQLKPGDLVYRNRDELDAIDELLVENEEESTEATNDNKSKETTSIFKNKVKALTEEDIASNNYNLTDIVLPLPGFDITYPENVVAKWYEEIMEEFDLSSEKLRHAVRSYAMPGAYRKLIIIPENITWQHCQYESAETPLIASDWEKLKGDNIDVEKLTGNLKALILDFCLPSSAYATMLLRELMKNDTSASNQCNLEKTEMEKHKIEEKNYENNVEDVPEEPIKNITVDKHQLDVDETDEIVECKKIKLDADAEGKTEVEAE